MHRSATGQKSRSGGSPPTVRVPIGYRKRGLDKTSNRIVAFVECEGLQGATVLEIGGGVGEIQLEVLKRGAASAVNLELLPAYDAQARRLLREAGIEEGRVERRRHDIAEDPDDVAPADVVCCTASSAVTPTTSGCSAPRRPTRSPIRHRRCSTSVVHTV